MVTHVVVVYFDVFCAAPGTWKDHHAGRVRENWGRPHLGEAELPQEVSKEYSVEISWGSSAYPRWGLPQVLRTRPACKEL